MSLIPQMVDQVDIPVIAAGGIADGRGFISALTLGASGVQMGTRFVCSEECTAHEKYKKAIINARDRDAVVTGRSTGHPVRNIKNLLTTKIKKMEKKGLTPESIEDYGKGKLRKAVIEGDIKEGSVMAGQISGLIKEIKPVSQIIEDLMKEANDILKETCKSYGVNNYV